MANSRTIPGTTKANDSPTTADCAASVVLIINSSRSAQPGHCAPALADLAVEVRVIVRSHATLKRLGGDGPIKELRRYP